MFSRIVTMHLKPNHIAEFTKEVEDKVLPVLRKQEGFRDEIFFTSQDGKEAIGISLWDRKENAETYNQKAYPEVLKAMKNVLEGDPQVKTYDVATSTIYRAAAQPTV